MVRLWIFNALCAVVLDGTYSNLYLKKNLAQVSSKDQPLATRIFYGTLQNYRYCEYVWKSFANRKANKKIQVLLTMSVYQLLFLDKVPEYAICNDAVSIAKKVDPKAAGFVNAVLRKTKTEPINLPENPIALLAIESSLPEWLISMWKAQYGWDQTCSICKYSNQIVPVIVRRNNLKISEADFLKNGSFSKFEDDLYIYNGNDIANHEYYQKGWMSIQDEGSYKIARALDVSSKMSVLDVCAAPGTKTMALAEMMNNQGSIDALDIHEHRVDLINNDARRLGIDIVHAQCQDACDLSTFGVYDRILCDVPCSGYGVLARKPDIKLSMKSTDMDSLIDLQAKILHEASKHLKQEGLLVYSTCTLNRKENEKQVQNFLKKNEDFKLIDEITLFPQENKDGFYYAILSKSI